MLVFQIRTLETRFYWAVSRFLFEKKIFRFFTNYYATDDKLQALNIVSAIIL
jgi:hypothetical protein